MSKVWSINHYGTDMVKSDNIKTQLIDVNWPDQVPLFPSFHLR